MEKKKNRGNTALELMVSVAIIALIAGITVPDGQRCLRRAAVLHAALTVRELLSESRTRAQLLSRAEGVRFTEDAGVWSYSVYEDGDGDGIHTDDIAAGKDRLIEGPAPLNRPAEIAKIGFPPQGLVDIDSGAPMASGDRPVQFNRTSLCSFSADGTATPGSIYFASGSEAAAVRASDSGFLDVRRYDGASRSWQR